MNKKILVLLFSLIFVSSRESKNLPVEIAKKAFETIKSSYKLYYLCTECGDKVAKPFIVHSKGVDPVSDGNHGYEYKFFVNKKEYINILNYYLNSGEKWINLGLFSGLVDSRINYELNASQIPYDVEVEAEKEFSQISEITPLSIFEKKILDEINLVRKNPQEYANILRARIPFFENNIYRPVDRKARQTKDGAKGIENAIHFLENSTSLPPLKFSPEFSTAISENFKNPIHYKSRWRELRERYGKLILDAELVNIIEGEFFGYNIAPDLVAYILVNEGNGRRDFRTSILDSEIKHLGLGCKPEKTYGYQCHIALSSGLKPEDNIITIQEERKTTSSISYLSEFEKKVIEETNLLRTKPKEYAEFLKERRKFYSKKTYKEPFRAPVNLVEGISALEEAILFLENAEPVSFLNYSKELSLAARDHVNDSGKRGLLGHYGSDGSSPLTRVLRHKKDAQLAGENIDYGWVDPRDVVISLLVDDGVANRGHRTNLFHKDFMFIGVACGFHRDYPLICVQNFGAW